MPGCARSWLVVRTKPRQEKIAVGHLAQRDVEPYCPMFLRPPWHARAPRGPVPLFAGYIFVHGDPVSQLNAVRYCPGVLGLVSFDGSPAVVEHEMIEALRQREGDRGYVLPNEFADGIPDGATVRVMAGPLEGIRGVFRGYLRGRERARILMDFLRSRHEVEVDAAALAMLRA
jgi:transcription antitermination factor NusG